MPGFDILHEDSACLVVAKPPGLLTQAPLGIDSLEFRIKAWLKEKYAKPGGVYLGVPHRLDRPVSGVIVFAKNVRAARRISEQFEGRLVEKRYWALVSGDVQPSAATWTDQLKKIEGEPRSVVVDHTDPEGKLAILHYQVVQRTAGHSLLEIVLETGRTHQIRVQCASRGHPLLGDELYGSTEQFGEWHADERQRLIALHARSLRFRLPTTNEFATFVADLPAMWTEAGVEGAKFQEPKIQEPRKLEGPIDQEDV
jgi:23S rRNA pseudouridine1911/1915/1917 synthase